MQSSLLFLRPKCGGVIGHTFKANSTTSSLLLTPKYGILRGSQSLFTQTQQQQQQPLLQQFQVRSAMSRAKVEKKVIRNVLRKKGEVRRKSSTMYGGSPYPLNETYLHQLLDAYSKRRQFRQAVRLFDKIVLKRAVPSKEIYRKFLYTVGFRAKQDEQALKIFQQFKKQYHGGKDVACWNIMIHSCVHERNHELATEYFNSMIELKLIPDSFTYHYLLKCYLPLKQTNNKQSQGDGSQKNISTTRNKSSDAKMEDTNSGKLLPLTEEEKVQIFGIIDHIKKYNPIFLANNYIYNCLTKLNENGLGFAEIDRAKNLHQETHLEKQ